MKILIAYDGSSFADAAIDDLPKAGLPANAEALVVCVADGGGVHFDQPEGNVSSRSRLGEAEKLAETGGCIVRSYFPSWTVSTEALWGSPAKVILDTSDWWHPDLLIVGSHGRSGFARLILGSVSLQLLSKAACSVRVGRDTGSLSDNGSIRLVIGNDGSEEAQAVIRSVAARIWPKNTQAQIISVVQTLAPATTALDASTYAQEPAYSIIHEADVEMGRRLEKVAADSEDVLRSAGLIATSEVLDGDPREIILSTAARAKADTIFVGARGHGRMERLLLGSVSNYIVTHASCTVEVMRARHG
jgi:nucleotide-binding universal stress UspA family protein